MWVDADRRFTVAHERDTTHHVVASSMVSGVMLDDAKCDGSGLLRRELMGTGLGLNGRLAAAALGLGVSHAAQ